jgi:hypothetical protein
MNKHFPLKTRLALLLSALVIGVPDGWAQISNEPPPGAEPIAPAAESLASRPTGGRPFEKHFESLTVGELVFTNVWVNRQTNFNILIRHRGGIHTIRLTDLPQEELDALRPQLGDLANIELEKDPELVARFREMQGSSDYPAMVTEQLRRAGQAMENLLVPLLVVLLVLHLVSSLFIFAICRKTNTKAGFEVWLPVLNQTALLRAAGLPGVWALLGFMAPLLPPAIFAWQLVPSASISGLMVMGISLVLSVATAIVWLVWCFKICIAREKHALLGILLLIPGVNVLTFAYLAFAD